MNPVFLAMREMLHRWRSSVVVALIVTAVTGTLTYFSVNNDGFQREIRRNVRDIGSNVVILPADVDSLSYHDSGGYSDVTMSDEVVQQLIEYKASLNHLIPMLERRALCQSDTSQAEVRVVGIAASIAMPGRPKAPMQRAVKPGGIQLGSLVARKLGITRDSPGSENVPVLVSVGNASFAVQRVNRESGTWQDSVVFIDLADAQQVFGLPSQISRIEAIECTQEECRQTGLKSDVVLANELARITDQAVLFRREKMAEARSSIRYLSVDNLQLLQNSLWIMLVLAIVGLALLNALQRRSEIGVLQAVGYGQMRIVCLLMVRSFLLAAVGSLLGIVLGAAWAFAEGGALFANTGKKMTLNWETAVTIGMVAIGLSCISTVLPAFWAASQNPADMIGKEA